MKTTQKARLHQIAEATRHLDRAPEPARRRAHRRDGWPCCPQCGEDELMSTAPVALGRRPEPTDPMRCLGCGWSGTVAAPVTQGDGR